MAENSRVRKSDKKKVLVAGDAMLDTYHFGNVERISPEAPVPVFLENGKEKRVPGGAANVAVNIASIGIETEFCSVVGEDKCGKDLLDCLASSRVGINYVAGSSERGTTVKLRYIGPGNQQILRVDAEDDYDVPLFLMGKILCNIEADISEYGVFILSDYRKGFLTEDIAQKLISMAVKYNIPVLVDVKDSNIAKYRNATILKPNRRELKELTGKKTDTKENVINAAVDLCTRAKCTYVLATLGADGMILVDKNGLIEEVKSTASEVYDVTGAGDTSIAYLAAEMAKGRNVTDAMVVANYAAGVQVSKVGTSIVHPDEVDAAMHKDGRLKISKCLDFYENEGLSILERKKASGKKVVFTNGCFDIIHAGHISYLKKARQLGDILVVGVNSDKSVKRLKGEDRPINVLSDRLLILAALEDVDYVIPFEEDTPKELIEQVIPDILVKGGDYQIEDIVGADFVIRNGGEVKALPFVEGRSTTSMIRKIQEG